MSKLLKKILVTVSTFLLSEAAFALPGVSHYIPDSSGQFVYYKDNSFSRESYIGALYYDDATYVLRYYAPNSGDKKNFQPEKDIQIAFSLDASKDYIKLTGENILTSVTQDDVELINYMHDFLYEMNARRKNAGIISEKTKIEQDYAQFGGIVELEYDPLIPIFNLLQITNNKNKPLLSLVTAGQLTASEDTTFKDFKGLPELKTDKSSALKLKKNAKKEDFSYQPESSLPVSKISLDSQWQKQDDNLFSLGNAAVLSMNLGVIDNEIIENLLKRSLILGREHVYPDLENIQIQDDDNSFSVKQYYYYAETNSFSVDYKKIIKSDSSLIGVLTLTVYYSTYLKNKKYFDAILTSYAFN